MKYLVTYMGVTSGSFMGRDDGYPEQKTALVEESRLHLYENSRDLKIYAVTPLDASVSKQLMKTSVDNKYNKVKEVEAQKKKALSKLSPTEKQLLGLR